MAANILKVGNDPNSAIKTFCVDTIEEIAKLPTMEHGATGDFTNIPGLESPAPMGSQAIVGNESFHLVGKIQAQNNGCIILYYRQ